MTAVKDRRAERMGWGWEMRQMRVTGDGARRGVSGRWEDQER